MSGKPFTSDSLIIDALEAHPNAKEIFLQQGLPCHRCWVAEDETIAVGARSEGVDPEKIVAELNRLLGR